MKKRGLVLTVAVLAVLVSAGPVWGQEPALQDDPLFATLFPPELIMQHRQEIDLTDQQRDQISKLIQDLQGRVVQMQRDLLDRMRQLTRTTSASRVDLDRALDQLDNVLDTEKSIKQANLEMLVRVKNLLTPDQQATLTRLRGTAR
jgi:Spy/CpxP family protein refolding chaperone